MVRVPPHSSIPIWIIILQGLLLVETGMGFTQQSFIEYPKDISVIENESVILRCKIRNLAGVVQWTSDGFAMGYSLETIRNFCKKCEPYGDTSKGEYHLKVNNVELNRHNNFECQVTPDPRNQHKELRASAHINVLVPAKNISLEPSANTQMRANIPSKLTCRVWETNPQAHIVWLLDGQVILDHEIQESVSKGRRQGTYDTEKTLIFTPTPRNHGATITCRVEQKHPLLKNKAVEEHTTLTVYYSPRGPVIKGYEKDNVYREGDQINITCLALGGNPAPSVKWYKEQGKKKIKQDMNEVQKNNMTSSILSLRASSELHGSVYTCETWNNFTEVSIPSIPVYLNISFSPDLVEIEGPSFVEFGSSVSISCVADNSNPPARINWWIDGDTSSGRTRQELSPSGGYKTISTKQVYATTNNDQIKVTCTAIADQREKKATKTIKIKRPPEKPVITGFGRHTIREGDILNLVCTSQEGSPVPDLEWTKDGARLPDQIYTKLDDTTATSKLTLKVTREDNNAEYSCTATNGVNFLPAVQKEKFAVYFPPKKSELYMFRTTGGADIQIATAGESVELRCNAGTSNPPALFHWIKDGVQVKNGKPGEESLGKYGGKVSTNTFQINGGHPVRAEDDGSNYTCVTYNPTMQAEPQTKYIILNVRYMPQYADTVETVYRVDEGADLHINMNAKANPDTIIYKWINQRELSMSPRFQFSGGEMKIKSAKREDAAVYVLIAENSVGRTDLQITVEVAYPARIQEASNQIEVEEGQTLEIFCKIEAKPLDSSTLWWTGPRGFDSRKSGIVRFDGNNTFSLTIPHVTKDNRGVYRCTADNGVHSPAQSIPDIKDTRVQVHFSPRIRKFSRFSKFSQNRMFPAKIPCYAYGYPRVSIFWAKEGDGVLNLNRFIFPADGTAVQKAPGTWLSELEIKQVENSDFGRYRCYANNSLGSDSHIISIVHNSRPDQIDKLEVKQLNNHTVRLKWEPGFNGGFKQDFLYRVREVSTDRIVYQDKAVVEELGEHDPYVEQNIILDLLGDYAFSIKSTNIQGDSPYSTEQFQSLKAAEVQHSGEGKLPRVVIVAIVLGSILVVIIKLIVITCCVKQRKDASRRHRERIRERNSSESSKKSVGIERYPAKYATSFGGDLFLSPPSNTSGSSYSDQDYTKHIGRSISVPGESDVHTSYTSCSVHGTLGRHISSNLDTTLEDDVFDELGRSVGGGIHHSSSGGGMNHHHSNSIHKSGSIHHTSGGHLGPPGHSGGHSGHSGGHLGPPGQNLPPYHHNNFSTGDRFMRSGRRSRAGSLSSPANEMPNPPRLGVSGLYTDYMERRKHSTGGSISPPSIPSPPPPIDISTLGRRMPPMPPIPSLVPNGGHNYDLNRPVANELSNEITRRINELGSNSNLDPPDSMQHLHLDQFNFSSGSGSGKPGGNHVNPFNTNPRNENISIRAGALDKYRQHV